MYGRNLCVGAAMVVLWAIALPAPAIAGVTPLAAEFQINHADPEASVPGPAARNSRPLEFGYFIQDLVTFAETAAKSGDHVAESRYYRALTKAVPDSSMGFSKLCESMEAAGRREEAVSACRSALGLVGVTLKDYIRFVRLILAKTGDLTTTEMEDVSQVVQHLRQAPDTRVAGSHLQCEFGVRVASVSVLQECTAVLATIAPDDPKTIAFQWALALRKGDEDGARRLIARAKTTGMKPQGIARMESTTGTFGRTWRRWFLDWRLVLAVAVLASASLATLYARHRRTSKVGMALRGDAT